MSSPRAVVIPFGVPTEGQGLGLGLAALVHAFAHVEGAGVGLAQLQTRRTGEHEPRGRSLPVEAFVPPAAWRDIAGRGVSESAVGVVLTGSFEPPGDGQGTIHLLAFDSRDGHTCAQVRALIDDERAGATLVGALEQLWSGLRGEIGALHGLRELQWDSLESVLRGERCALHDPTRGGPHDRLAAMLHFGRAIGDAPGALYPAERLASLALDAAIAGSFDGKAAAAGVRALERALDDAPSHPALVEALTALLLRLGRTRDAERRMNAAIAAAPRRSRPYALLAHALRAQGKLEEAHAAVQAGLVETGGDPGLDTERGLVLAQRGDLDGARVAWSEALAREPLYPPAYGHLAELMLRVRDSTAAQTLVDAALSSTRAHPDVLRRAVQLALSTEADGLSRAARVARLCERILEALPDDAQATLILARALIALGNPTAARARLDRIERVAPSSAAGAEAQVTRLALDEPGAERDMQRILRAARTSAIEDLTDVGARARRVATLHNAWPGWLAAGIAELRRGRWAAARGALEVAVETAPGATSAHIELGAVLLELDDAPTALAHAERALALEGETPRVLCLLARTLAAAGRSEESRLVMSRALIANPDDDAIHALARRLRERRVAPGWRHRLRHAFARWRRWKSDGWAGRRLKVG
jgi:tetratricopeptide (TPR) repeat protein